MKKLFFLLIILVCNCFVSAQQNASLFKKQLQEMIDGSRNNFPEISLPGKLENNKIIKLEDSTGKVFYHVGFGRSHSKKNASLLKKRLQAKISNALGMFYLMESSHVASGTDKILFRHKDSANPELIILKNSCKLSNCVVSLDVYNDDRKIKNSTHIFSETGQKVVEILINKLGVSKDEITPGARLTNDLGADELDTVELLMECEKEFSLKIGDDEFEKLYTVSMLIDFLEKKLKENK